MACWPIGPAHAIPWSFDEKQRGEQGMSKDPLTDDYVRDVARSAQGVKISPEDATVVALTIGPFNRMVREAALDLPFEAEPAGFLLALEAGSPR
ncbi:hypothetical protein STAQ_50350 [Allostella sp. ATCC 35155]|nr:hypothetical protein STAQ_50350 [Stella sp. ATCC 35155]